MCYLSSARLIVTALCTGMLSVGMQAARVGAQREEYLANSVCSVSSAAVAGSHPLRPVFTGNDEQLDYLRRLAEMPVCMSSKIPQASVRVELIKTARYEAERAGLDSALAPGFIQMGSGSRRYAISSTGVMGLIQMMSLWTRSAGDNDSCKLFHLQSNLRYSCTILCYYFDMGDDNLYLALSRYNGNRGQPQYPNTVLTVQKRWQYQELSTMTVSAPVSAESIAPMPCIEALSEVPARNPLPSLRIAGGPTGSS